MIYFTKYAEEKFEILNKYKVFFTREQIEEVLSLPDEVEKSDRYFFARKEGIKVIYIEQGENKKVITFYPVKP